MPPALSQGASPLVGWLLVVSPPGEQRQGAWRRVDVLSPGSWPPGPLTSAPNPQVRPELWLLGVEPQGVAPSGVPPSEVLLSALPQVAPQIRALLCRAQQYRGEWVLPAGPQVVWPPEASPLVGSLHQVLLVSLLQEPLHPESPRRVRPAGLLVALPPEALLLVASPRQVLPRQALVVPSIRESPPPMPQPLGLLASPPQVGQQQEKRQAVGPSPQRS